MIEGKYFLVHYNLGLIKDCKHKPDICNRLNGLGCYSGFKRIN